jgi:thioredoxin reductase (NADPH)
MTEAGPTPSVFETRRDQVFPILDPVEINRVRRFGAVRSYRAGEALVKAGAISPGLMIILSGEVDVTRDDLAGRTRSLVTESSGTFLGELAQLAGRPALTDAHARSDVEALIIPPTGCAKC